MIVGTAAPNRALSALMLAVGYWQKQQCDFIIDKETLSGRAAARTAPSLVGHTVTCARWQVDTGTEWNTSPQLKRDKFIMRPTGKMTGCVSATASLQQISWGRCVSKTHSVFCLLSSETLSGGAMMYIKYFVTLIQIPPRLRFNEFLSVSERLYYYM